MNNSVFFVDDEPHIRDAVSQALLIEGIDVTCLPNAVEALRVIDSNTPAIIITDIHMPVMDGIEAARCIRKDFGNQPYIISLSGNTSEKERDRCRQAGMNAYLDKPIRRPALTNALRQALKA